uniref:Cystatin domain-containing protein n=1 Tax=Oryza meridionalis TaxID=40149 RepID=A0A0E0DCT2_9ORYZ
MATSPLLMLLLLVAAAAAAAGDEASLSPSNAAAPTAPVLVGGRTEIRDVGGNKAVQSLGRFAVAEHNRRLRHGGSGGPADPVPVKLAFARVVEAQKQVVSGVAYYLKVAARDPRGAAAAGDRVFDAVVVVKAWLKSKELVSFTPAASTK